MAINKHYDTHLPRYVALLIIVAMTAFVIDRSAEITRVNQYANNLARLQAQRQAVVQEYLAWQRLTSGKVALASANIPLISGATRLTFDSKNTVRYRINVPAQTIANYYSQVLADQGWKKVALLSENVKADKLTIAYQENPISNKTEVTYSYFPVNAPQVLGMELAQAEPTNPVPSQPVPAPTSGSDSAPLSGDNLQTPVQQPMQPIQPMLPNQPMQPIQPMLPNQPMQPNTEQMQFMRQPMQPSMPGDQNQQTCRVNGVDMPGSCENYNNQGPNSGGEQMNGGMGNQGPSEEEMQKMDEQRFKDMKRGLSSFTKGAKSMKKMLARVKTANSKCGVGVPEELENALAQADDLAAKINAAKTADELDEVIGDIQDVSSVMQDWGPRMGDLQRLCQMLKQAGRDLTSTQKVLKRSETRIKNNTKIDWTSFMDEYRTNVNGLSDALQQAKDLAKTDQDAALSKIEDDFYGNMDNVRNYEMQFETLFNMTKGMQNIDREMKKIASQLKSLKNKKVDVSEAADLYSTLSEQLAEIKAMIKDKAATDDLTDKINEMFDTRQQLQDWLQDNGQVNMEPQIKGTQSFNVKVNLPDAFTKPANESTTTTDTSMGQ